MLISVVAAAWVAALFLAPAALALARAETASQEARMPVLAAMVYLGGSAMCHQRPERSFHIAGAALPVCARCTGLHVGFAAGLFAVAVWRRSTVSTGRWRRWRRWLLLAMVPMAWSIAAEWAGSSVSLATRAVSALPVGVVVGSLVAPALGSRRARPDIR